MNQVTIHCKDSDATLDMIKELNLNYTVGDGEYDIIVEDMDYDPNHYFVDPDEQLCDNYDIDYDLVNCIEGNVIS